MKDIKDYLPYYIGQKCSTPDGIGTIQGLPWAINCHDRVHVHFAKMVRTENSIDGGHSKVRNHGVYAISAGRYEPIGTSGVTEDGFDMPGGVKPILRRLSDMTEQEMKALYRTRTLWAYIQESHIKKIQFSEGNQNCITIGYEGPSGSSGYTCGNELMYLNQLMPTQFHYLLKQGFDLFGLIDEGAAIDAKTIINKP